MITYQEKLTVLATGSTRETRPRANLARFRMNGETITDIDIWVDFSTSIGSNVFNFLLNGVPQFVGGARPTIAAGGSHSHIGGLSIATNDGDIASFDLQVVGAGGVNLPVYFRVTTDAGGGGGDSWDSTIIKPTTAVINSGNTGTTYVADPALTFAIPAGALFAFEGRIWVSMESGAVSMKFRHHFTQAPQASRVSFEFINSSFGAGADSRPNAGYFSPHQTTAADQVIGAANFFSIIDIRGYVKGHASLASAFEFQYAQNSSHADDLLIDLGSVLSYKQL